MPASMFSRMVVGTLRLGVVLSLALGISASRADADCVSPHWAARSMGTLSAVFPRTGAALVIAMTAESASGTLTTADPPALNVTRGRRTSWPLTPIQIAPGLYRVPFDAHVTRGVWTLHGLGPDATLTIGAGVLPGVAVRPAVREVRRVAATGIGAAGGQRIEVRANLEFPVPEGVIASIVTWNTDASPAAWARAAAGQREIVLYTEPVHCAGVAPGTTPPPDGPLVVHVAWVDQLGQVSPTSDAITVQ